MFAALLVSFFLFLVPLILFLSIPRKSSSHLPKSYPLIGSHFALLANKDRRIQWTSDLLQHSPSATYVLHRTFGRCQIFTASPANVQHILKTHFHNYHKGNLFRSTLHDFLGAGIFTADGDTWKFQRQLSSHEFNTKSLRNFFEHVVDTELSDRLIPFLSATANTGSVIDFQDILQRFAFDNICKIAFGFDPAYLLPSLPEAKFALAFEDALRISCERFNLISPIIWKIKRIFGIGPEKHLKIAISEVREFARIIIAEKKQELKEKSSMESVDLLSRFLGSGNSDEKFVTDIVVSFILAGRDTTSAALTWFFWLISVNQNVQNEILNEIRERSDTIDYDEVKKMTYTHAALGESMRLYPPVPTDSKEAANDDVLADGTVVKKGWSVTYHPYAMGRSVEIWGSDWAEFRPERWLESDETAEVGKRKFVARDPFTYPVFQAGPRICLGKEMAFLQMKKVVADVLRRFKVVPAADEDDEEPFFMSYLTAKMKGGFPVRIEEREGLLL